MRHSNHRHTGIGSPVSNCSCSHRRNRGRKNRLRSCSPSRRCNGRHRLSGWSTSHSQPFWHSPPKSPQWPPQPSSPAVAPMLPTDLHVVANRGAARPVAHADLVGPAAPRIATDCAIAVVNACIDSAELAVGARRARATAPVAPAGPFRAIRHAEAVAVDAGEAATAEAGRGTGTALVPHWTGGR